MADIDFEEQLALEKEEKEKEEKSAANTRVDPDGTQYEWDEEKKAWFPKIDQNFIAQYQMNYGREEGKTSSPSLTSDLNQAEGEGQTEGEGQSSYDEYYNYYRDYHNAGAQHENILNRQRRAKKVTTEDTTEEALEKLEKLENTLEQLKESGGDGSVDVEEDEDMSNYTQDQIRQYNDYWNYYYGTQDHDYYSDCMMQQNEGQGDLKEQEEEKKGKKRKGQQQPERPEGWFNIEDSDNTNVYVSDLPFDISEEEFQELMAKYGMIMFDPRTKKPKVKLYRDENGEPKGDGRCCYIKVESVDLCLKLLDGYDYNGHKVHVQKATFQMKGQFDPSKKKKKLSNKEKKKLKEQQAKLFDWRPERPQGSRQKWEKVVILKNVFDPVTFEENPLQINSVRNTIRTECSKYGEVKKVTVYDRNADGVVSVFFKEPEEADNCVDSMHQRYLGLQRILAATWDGQTKYEVVETEAEKEERLKKWTQFLEDSEKMKEGVNSAGETSVVDSSTNSAGETSAVDSSTNSAGETSVVDSSTNSAVETSAVDSSTNSAGETSVVDSSTNSAVETSVVDSSTNSADTSALSANSNPNTVDSVTTSATNTATDSSSNNNSVTLMESMDSTVIEHSYPGSTTCTSGDSEPDKTSDLS